MLSSSKRKRNSPGMHCSMPELPQPNQRHFSRPQCSVQPVTRLMSNLQLLAALPQLAAILKINLSFSTKKAVVVLPTLVNIFPNIQTASSFSCNHNFKLALLWPLQTLEQCRLQRASWLDAGTFNAALLQQRQLEVPDTKEDSCSAMHLAESRGS